MTAETVAELRARLGALAEAATERPWEQRGSGYGVDGQDPEGRRMAVAEAAPSNAALIVALVNAWPAIDGMLARLAAAEAEREALIFTVQLHAGIHPGFGLTEKQKQLDIEGLRLARQTPR